VDLRISLFLKSLLAAVFSAKIFDAWLCCDYDFLCNWAPYLQGTRTRSDAWPISYEIAGSSSAAVERRAPSTGELSLIRSLRDQLKCTQQELRRVTAKVDIALSKASLAANAERFLLGEIENLGKAMKCKYFCTLDVFLFRSAAADHLFVECRCVPGRTPIRSQIISRLIARRLRS
jgi:hypothetical protein